MKKSCKCHTKRDRPVYSRIAITSHAKRKPMVMELVGKLGFDAVDAGPLKNARLLEPLAMVWIDQAMSRGRGRDFAFALVTSR